MNEKETLCQHYKKACSILLSVKHYELMLKALNFYANQSNYEKQFEFNSAGVIVNFKSSVVKFDKGHLAREVLKTLGKDEAVSKS